MTDSLIHSETEGPMEANYIKYLKCSLEIGFGEDQVCRTAGDEENI
jgi:hypothetical protein